MKDNNHFNMRGKFVVVAGGSKGLGKELALELVTRGSHVTIIARSEKGLEETRTQMERLRVNSTQLINKISLDLTNIQEVSDYINALEISPSALFCVAGGTAEEIGFFANISAGSIKSCMEKNYFSSAYVANAVMKRWIADPSAKSSRGEDRHIVFTASTAALVAVPGYAAYSPTKAAIRALADTLRLESLMYCSRVSIKIHCSFPGTIYTETFYKEQANKPDFCKQVEGTMDDLGGQPAGNIARLTLAGLEAGKYLITTDMQTRLLLSNMRGPSPKDSPLVDWLMGFLASLLWPLYRMYLDRKTVDWQGRFDESRGGST